jgi:hypothetical protein
MDVTYAYTGLNSSLTAALQTKTQLMDQLTNQLVTKMKSPTYAGIENRSLVLSFQSALASSDAYLNTISQVNTQMTLITNAIENMSKVSASLSTSLDRNVYQPTADGTTAAQTAAMNSLDSYVTSLNGDYDGNYMFGGRKTDQQPVLSSDVILNGDAAHAGYKQVAAERLQADLGVNGLGRLDLGVVGPSLALTEEGTGTNVFGMKLGGVVSTLSNATITGGTSAGPAPHSLTVDLTGQPTAGEKLTLTLTQPDGTTSTISLTAGTETSDDGTTFAIGATAVDTMANLQTALTKQLQTVAASDLTAASAVTAANDFFDTASGAPRRLDLTSGGGTAATATSLTAGTSADTVIWYRGTNDGTSARADASTAVDTGVSVNFGIRANESAFTTQIKALAVMATVDVSAGTSDAKLLYGATIDRVKPVLNDRSSTKSLQAIETEIVGAQSSAKLAQQRLKIQSSTYQTTIANALQIDDTTVGVEITTLQTQIESSYKAAAILYKLSLTNYL